MISFFKNFPTNFKSKIINGSYESINTYAILLALRSESVIYQRSFIESSSSSKCIYTLKAKIRVFLTSHSLLEKDLKGVDCKLLQRCRRRQLPNTHQASFPSIEDQNWVRKVPVTLSFMCHPLHCLFLSYPNSLFTLRMLLPCCLPPRVPPRMTKQTEKKKTKKEQKNFQQWS